MCVKVYYWFYIGMIVLGMIEDYVFFCIGQVWYIMLEILVVVIMFVGFFECNYVGVVWVEMFGDVFDQIIFVSCIVVF